MSSAPDRSLRGLAGWLGVAALVEMALLRTGTRTLIHIPGLGRFEVSIGLLGEVGRFAYYLALVLVVATLLYAGRRGWGTGTAGGRVIGLAAWAFLTVALLARLDVVPGEVVALVSLMLMTSVIIVTWRGAPSLPFAAYLAAWGLATWSVLGQGQGGGLTGGEVDIAVVLAEAFLILTGTLSPLLVRGRTTGKAMLASVVIALMVAAGLSVGGSTLAILTLWNLGVPGWLSPLAYAVAVGGLTFTLWSTAAHRLTLTACSVVLMVTAGVGPISTYQTALAVTAVILFGLTSPIVRNAGPEPHGITTTSQPDMAGLP